MHADFSTKLSFPTYYGRNLDAFDDCLGDLAEHDYGWTPDVTGLVLVFNRYDEFAQRRPVTAQKVLDIVARRSRGAMLLGERLIGLVQSDDGQIEFHRVGATNVEWNPAEWTISGRE